MASELTVTLLRFGFLALLWVFVFVILAAQRRDLGVGRVCASPLCRVAVAPARPRPRPRRRAPRPPDSASRCPRPPSCRASW
ncbi:Uncharacterised protein [Rothia kristinae]|nr:Uncharacterised protein [Rothia kristinae]